MQSSRRFLGVTIPRFKHLGPLLVVWGAAMLMLVFIRDLGSSLMYFGAFLALIYVATNRLSFVVVGLVLFGVRRVVLRHDRRPRPGPHRHLAGPVPALPDARATRSPTGCSRWPTAGCSGKGSGAALLNVPGGGPLLPAPQTDMIYAVIVNDLGLVGGCGVILTYLLIAERGFKTATLATDSFSKLLATGLTAVMALQVFVIIGGVTRVIPLTGVTLPFVSYGGSSIVANFMLLALLLLISNRARQPAS